MVYLSIALIIHPKFHILHNTSNNIEYCKRKKKEREKINNK